MTDDALIPPTPSAEDYAREAEAQEAFGVSDDQGEVFTSNEPFALFAEWLALAKRHEANDSNALALATVAPDGMPEVRMVLLKDLDDGFTFYTNTQSAKGEALAANPRAAMCFHWKSIRRQVRVAGPVEPVAPEEADAYFASRSRGARIGAWASDQSRKMGGKDALKARIADREEAFEGRDVPRPDHWSGYRLMPQRIEFWVNRPHRLHDRLLFERDGEEWRTSRLYP
ncbi:pyridoxamine 5'-phosphate oxidase [Parvularcula oceani]|uniref:pyridoxamine 5'-phosphate oxidase n=1 Tax=Parvularcula oceani TaxID=1247963 RepID=UPI0004E0CD34|nr:pyridoxamine 5'-phosphate oxidase [Parvularcula oceani]